jgi:uncharacterized membrane protein YfcA
VLLIGHGAGGTRHTLFTGSVQMVAGAAGFAIGVVASLLGVAGGKLLIPTLTLLFGVDVKLAGSPSLAVSLPAMLVGFASYSRDSTFAVLRHNGRFVAAMVVSSIVGSFIGGQAVGHRARGDPATNLGGDPADIICEALAASEDVAIVLA